jgi:hypothetical protein
MHRVPSKARPTPPSTISDLDMARMRRELQRLMLITGDDALAAEWPPDDLVLPDFDLAGLERFIRTGRIA